MSIGNSMPLIQNFGVLGGEKGNSIPLFWGKLALPDRPRVCSSEFSATSTCKLKL
jgi:hypothetical protein